MRSLAPWRRSAVVGLVLLIPKGMTLTRGEEMPKSLSQFVLHRGGVHQDMVTQPILDA